MEDMKRYESMTVQEKWNILATVANLYYNSEMTQNEIADRMYTSRSKISRMLKEARELGIVEISIKEHGNVTWIWKIKFIRYMVSKQ